MTDYKITAKEHRANARKTLGGNIFSSNWLMSLVVLLIYTAIVGAISFISSLIGAFIPFLSFAPSLIGILISGPLLFGMASYFLALSRSNSAKVETLFDGFSTDFATNFLIGLMTYLFTFLWSLLLFIPGIIKGYAYSMAYYIKHDNPTYNWKQCLDESQRIMKGKKWKLFCLDISFIGWIIVGAFACGVGTFWVEPYMQAARASFYESIIEKPTEENFDVYTEAV